MTNTSEEKELLQLTAKQKKFLKGLGHHLEPLILIGKEGMTESIVRVTLQELTARELIKVKIASTSQVNKQDAAAFIPHATGSHLVQMIGKTLLLYKENPKKNKEQRIILPH